MVQYQTFSVPPLLSPSSLLRVQNKQTLNKIKKKESEQFSVLSSYKEALNVQGEPHEFKITYPRILEYS